MVFADALAAGLPIVACAAGAVTGTVPQAASLLVPVDDPAALATALRTLLADGALRKCLSDAAWDAGAGLPSWDATGAAVAHVLSA
jgi:glycosyltransferase involved in cell wall biosynthesis